MEAFVKRFDRNLPLPAYQTTGAAATDCCAREEISIKAQSWAYVPLNIAIKMPKGHFVLMAARSSLHKKGLMLANGIAIFDEDFSGDEDEYKAVLYNFTNEQVVVNKGDRITQLIFLPYEKVSWKEVNILDNTTRGGFGTTGNQ